MQMNKFQQFLLVFWAILSVSVALKIEKCSKNDPHVNECLKNLLSNLYRNFRQGKADERPSNVVKIDKIVVEDTLNLDVRGIFDNVLVKGLDNMEILEVKSNLSKLRMDVKFHITNLEFKTKYYVAGGAKLLHFPFESRGNNRVDASDLVGILKLHLVRKLENGETYLHIDKSLLDFTFKNAKFKFEDQKTEYLGPILSQLVNDNPGFFVNAFKKPLTKVFGETIKKIFQNMLSAPEKTYFID